MAGELVNPNDPEITESANANEKQVWEFRINDTKKIEWWTFFAL